MRTHEFGDALIRLGRMLRDGPNTELKDWHFTPKHSGNGLDAADTALTLSALAALSRISKTQWRELVDEWGFPIEIRATYSVRDTVGKILGYLADHPEAIRKLQTASAGKGKKASPELTKALSLLLGMDRISGEKE